MKHTCLRSPHLILSPLRAYSGIFSYICTPEACTPAPGIMRRPSPLQHMLGYVAEATLTACLTAASVCYRHGPVSTPFSFPLPASLPPSFFFLSLFILHLTSIAFPVLISLLHSLHLSCCMFYFYALPCCSISLPLLPPSPPPCVSPCRLHFWTFRAQVASNMLPPLNSWDPAIFG